MVKVSQLVILFLIISIFPSVMATCGKDGQAHAQLFSKILSSKGECPLYKGSYNSWPDIPTDLHISRVTNEGLSRLNVSWRLPRSGMEHIQGFQIQYWDYTDRDNVYGVLGQCVTFNITSNIAKAEEVNLYHDCVRISTKHIILSSLPQRGSSDYLHRIAVVYNQNYGDFSAWWVPSLVVLHNDSCQSEVDVQLDLAPAHFNFRNYRIVVRDADKKKHGDVKRKDIRVEPGTKMYTTTFTNVPDGNFIAQVFPEPDDRGRLCKCPNCKESGCYFINTSAFIINRNHSKCWKPLSGSAAVVGLVDHQDTPSSHFHLLLWISLFVACVILLFALSVLALVFKSCHKPSAHSERGQYRVANTRQEGGSTSIAQDEGLFQSGHSLNFSRMNNVQSQRILAEKTSNQNISFPSAEVFSTTSNLDVSLSWKTKPCLWSSVSQEAVNKKRGYKTEPSCVTLLHDEYV